MDELVEVHLEQGSPEWHAFRRSVRPASMASWVTGTSKYSNMEDAYAFYVEGKSPQFSKWAQKNLLDRGHAQEALARDTLELVAGEPGRAGVFRRGEYGASLDFLGESSGRPIDIKAPKDEHSKTWLAAVKGEIEPQYRDQIEQQCRVMGAPAGELFVYLNDQQHRLIPYRADDQRWGEIRRAWDALFELIAKGQRPGPVEVTDRSVKELLDTYAKLDESIGQLKTNQDAVRKELEKVAAGRSIRAFGWTLSCERRQGSVDYKTIVATHCPAIDVEQYRGEPSDPFYKFTAPRAAKEKKA